MPRACKEFKNIRGIVSFVNKLYPVGKALLGQ